MLKIFDLGCEVSETGEPRVQLLGTGLTKIASTEIRDAWDKLEKNDKYSYLWVIACGAHETYGCNNNGDSWTEKDLQDTHHMFTTNAHVYLHHVNRDPAKSIGVPLFSWYNPSMHRIELILQLDKSNPLAQETIKKIEAGESLYVSIGAKQDYDVCSICGKKSKTRTEYCDHLRYNLKRILSDGKQVFTWNPNPRWFDISVVSKPAFMPAFALEKMASDGHLAPAESNSAEAGEKLQNRLDKIAAIDKLSDIIKQLDATPAEYKGSDKTINMLRSFDDKSLGNMDYPTLDPEKLDSLEVSPASILLGMLGQGAPLSLCELAHIAGRHHMGEDFDAHRHTLALLGMLPKSLDTLKEDPELLDAHLGSILSDYRDEFADAPTRIRIIEITRPVAQARISIIKRACDLDELEKLAGSALDILSLKSRPVGVDRSPIIGRVSQNLLDSLSANSPAATDLFHVQTADGSIYTTSRAEVRNAQNVNDPPRLLTRLAGAGITLGALAAICSNAPLVARLIAAAAFATVGGSLINASGERTTIQDLHGREIPINTAFHRTTTSLEKIGTAAAWRQVKSLAPALGMAVPAGLGLDYMLTRFRNRDNPYAEQEMGTVKRTLHRAGKFVADSPFTTLAGGAVAGGAGSSLLRGYMQRRFG